MNIHIFLHVKIASHQWWASTGASGSVGAHCAPAQSAQRPPVFQNARCAPRSALRGDRYVYKSYLPSILLYRV